ncbi:hypothetical protein PISS_a2830 [Pseudoalteromonas issachenkonii]|uniref:Uncharacterized protein n=1 Tax=Pseudoalteromonas issachenkonii TaxID=152297 RepID=A0ABN5C7G1_9GAMM|nr:hypothetical protein PISS_a2830 [Pseudoalteromonas issachenkonii]
MTLYKNNRVFKHFNKSTLNNKRSLITFSCYLLSLKNTNNSQMQISYSAVNT